MSEHLARAALTRMNLREVAVAAHYSGIASDLLRMAQTPPEEAQKRYMDRRAEACAELGLNVGEQRKPFAFAGGMAIIPISGTLINRFGGSYEGWVTGYNFIRSKLNLALADDDVKGIVLDVNSYGGEAAGCFELAAEIRAARTKKPILAIVDSNAYSAGYALASAATKVVVTPSGGVGSVGVVAMHVDMSAAMEQMGVKVTLLYEAEHKVDGNPFQPLPDDVRADIQAGIHKSYEAFVSLVAANRGIDEKKVRDTKSRIYRADDALSIGFIDAIATPAEAARAFFSELSGSNHQQQGVNMSTAHTEPGKTTEAPSITPEKAAADARLAERARIAGITGSEEAKGRAGLANHLAMNTDMTVEAARAVLAAAPTEAAAASAQNPFKAAMDAAAHPNIGADGTGAEPGAEKSPAERILAAQRAAVGA